MPTKMLLQSIPCNAESNDVKRIMAFALDEAKRLYGVQKKNVCLELGINIAVLSRWLNTADGHTISAHLVRPFCRITRDWSLSKYLSKQMAS